MPNPLVERHRASFPNDTASDEELILKYGDAYGVDALKEFGDSADTYRKIAGQRRRDFAPGLYGEFTGGVKRGVDELQATLYGLGAFGAKAIGASGIQKSMLEGAARNEEEAQSVEPTIQGVGDVGSVSDAVRYAAGGLGEVAPSLGESIVTGIGGAVVGSSIGPEGTVGGGLAGLVSKQAIKNLIRRGIASEAKDLLASEVGKAALKSETKALVGRLAGTITTAANSLGLSTGEIYGDLARNPDIDPDTAFNVSLMGGAVAGAADTVLPSYIVGKAFKPILEKAAKEGVEDKVKKSIYSTLLHFGSEALKEGSMEAGTEGFQEYVGIMAKRLADPKTRENLALTKEDWTQILNAGAIGAIGGVAAAPLTIAGEGKAAPKIEKVTETIPEFDTAQSTTSNEPDASQTDQPDVAAPEQDQAISQDGEISTPDAPTVVEPTGDSVASQVTPKPFGLLPEKTSDSFAGVDPEAEAEKADFLQELDEQFKRNAIEAATSDAKYEEEVQSRTEAENAAKESRQAQFEALLRSKKQNQAEASNSGSSSEGVAYLPTSDSEESVVSAPAASTEQSSESSVSNGTATESGAVSNQISEQPQTAAGEVPVTENKEGGAIQNGELQGRNEGQGRQEGLLSSSEQPQLRPQDQAFVDLVDFEKSKANETEVIGTESEVGTKTAPGYMRFPMYQNVNQGHLSESQFNLAIDAAIYKDSTAGGSRSNTRKLAAFMSPDGKSVLVSAVWINTKNSKRVAFKGAPYDSLSIDELRHKGFVPIESVKLKKPVTGYSVTYSTPTWNSIAAELSARQGERRSFVDTMSSADLGGFEESTGEILGMPGVSAKTAEEVGLRPQAKLELSLGPSEVLKTIKEIGEPKWENEDEANEQIAQGLYDAGILETAKFANADPEKIKDLIDVIRNAYDKYESAGPAGVASILRSAFPKGVDSKISRQSLGDYLEGSEEEFRIPDAEGNNTATSGYVNEGQIRGSFNSALSKIKSWGINVSIFQSRLDTIGPAFFRTPGSGAAMTNHIALSLADITNPTRDGFVALLHEATHFVYRGIPEDVRLRLQRAIERLGVNPGSISEKSYSPDRVLTERLIEHIAQEGVERNAAEGYAHKLVRFIKDLALQVARLVQESLFGEGKFSDKISLAWFQNRVDGWLHGEDFSVDSLIPYIGGSRPSIEGRLDYFVPVVGGGWNSATFDPESGSIKVGQALPMSDVAMLHNADFRNPDIITDARPETALEDVAVQNTLGDIIQLLWTKAGSPGTIEQFAEQIVGQYQLPAVTVGNFIAKLSAGGRTPPPANVKMSDIKSAYSLQQAQAKLLGVLQSVERFMVPRVQEARSTSDRWKAVQKRESDRLLAWQQKYEDANFAYSEFLNGVKDLINEFKTQAARGFNLAERKGEIAQLIENLDGKLTGDLPSQWRKLLDTMATKLQGHPTAFFDLLQDVAALPLAWENTPITDDLTTGTLGLRSQIAAASKAYPSLEALEGTSPDSRALLVLVAAWAKRNAAQMDWIALRRAQLDSETKNGIQKMFAAAKSGAANAADQARSYLPRIAREGVRVGRILERFLQRKSEFAAMQKEAARETAIADMIDKSLPVIRYGMRKLENGLGAGKSFDLFEGAKLIVPSSSTVEEVDLDGETTKPFSYQMSWGDLDKIIKSCEIWIAAHPLGGARKQSLVDQVRILKQVQVGQFHQGMKNGLLATILGSAADLVEETGTAAGKAVATMLRRYETLKDAYHRDMVVSGSKVDASRSRVMKAMGIESSETFKALIHDNSLRWLENNRQEYLNTGAPFTDALSDLIRWLSTEPGAKDLISKPGAPELLSEYLTNLSQANSETSRIAKEMGIKILDPFLGIYREIIGDPKYTFRRKMSTSLSGVFDVMRGAWLSAPLDAEKVSAQYAADRSALVASLNDHFTPEVVSSFVRPMAVDPNKAHFSGERVGTVWSVALPQDIKAAWDGTSSIPSGPERVIAFAEALHAITKTSAPIEDFVGETLGTINAYFSSVNSQAEARSSAGEASRAKILVQPHELMDGRVSESWPSDWVTYADYGQRDNNVVVQKMAYHAAFGRDGVGLNSNMASARRDLQGAADRLDAISDFVIRENPHLSGDALRKAIDRKIRLEGKALPGGELNHWRRLRYASGQLDKLTRAENALTTYFNIHAEKSNEVNALADGLSLVTSMMLQGPKTAISNINTLFDHFVRTPLSRQTLEMAKYNVDAFLKSVWGGFYGAFSEQAHINSQFAKRRVEAGLVDGKTRLRLSERLAANSALLPLAPDAGIGEKIGRTVKLGLHNLKTTMEQTLSFVPPDRRILSTFNPFTNPFGTSQNWVDWSIIVGAWRAHDDLIIKAAKFFRSNPGARADLSYKITAADLGISNGLLLKNVDAFNVMTDRMQDWGMTLETVTREALAREDATGTFSALTPQYDRLIAASVLKGVSYQAAATLNRPAIVIQNPTLRYFTPLLGWTLSRTADMRKSLRTKTGEVNWQTALNGLKFMAAVLPAGLVMAWLRDEYDDHITGKRSDIRQFGEGALLPVSMERLARVGSFGLWGDLGNTAINMARSGDLRGVSVDERVIFLNTTFRTIQAVSTWAHQGEGTYDTVGRPLLQAIGGSGFLQTFQAINNAGSFDNAEARINARINVTNILRASGRGAGLEVRESSHGGGGDIPSPVRPWINKMILAALANDPLDFSEAYRKALSVAASEGRDPETAREYVKRSFQSRHPLRTVFKSPPSVSEFNNLLNSLGDSEKSDVQMAIRLINRYGSQVWDTDRSGNRKGIEPFVGSIKTRVSKPLTNGSVYF